MYKNVLQSIDNIALWPVISFVIFCAFFLGLLLWVVFANKNVHHLHEELTDTGYARKFHFNL